MKTEIVTITPQLAAHLLRFNHSNRPMIKSNVNYWKSCIVSGSALLTHQGIAIAGDLSNPERLIDGQHRLQGIVETGIPTRFMITMNVPQNTFEALDNGTPRSMSVRAGISKTESQLANTMFYILSSQTYKTPVSMVKDVSAIIAPDIEKIYVRKIKSFSKTGIILAFLLEQKETGRNHSLAFQTGQFSEMPESLCALYRRQSTIKEFGGGGATVELAAIAKKAIDNPGLKRLVIPSKPTQFMVEQILRIYPEIAPVMKKYGVNIKQLDS